MVNDPSRPLLPLPIGGKVQISDVVFPLALAPWLLAGFPGLGRVAVAAGDAGGGLDGGQRRDGGGCRIARRGVAGGRGVRLPRSGPDLGCRRPCGAGASASLRSLVGGRGCRGRGHRAGGLAGRGAVRSAQPPGRVGARAFCCSETSRGFDPRSCPRRGSSITLLDLALPAVMLLRRQGMPGERRWAGWLLLAMTGLRPSSRMLAGSSSSWRSWACWRCFRGRAGAGLLALALVAVYFVMRWSASWRCRPGA